MYQIKEHSDYFSNAGADYKKQFDMVKKLSKNFTVENDMALQLDKVLMEFKALDEPSDAKTPKSTASAPKKTSSNSKTDQSLQEKFEDLFENLKSFNPSNSSPINKAEVKEMVLETMKQIKVRYDDLDQDVQSRLSQQTQSIRYELPERTTPIFNKPPISSFQQIVDDLLLGNNVMLVGGAGTGKTFLAENLVAKMALARPHITINCSQWTSPTEIIGGQTMDGYVEGKLIEAWSKGYVLILDELPKIDPNTAGLFNDALAKSKLNEAVIFNARKESFTKHKDFACIATGNIYPDKESMSYGANNKQDLSLLDRFSGSVYFIEKNPAIERQVIGNDMIWSICDKMRSAIEELKYEAQLSLRFMQNARDSFMLEMKRLKDTKPNGIKANEGKTFRSAVDNFLSTFTEVQQKNIKAKIRYSELFSHYEYREFDTSKQVF